MTPAQVIGTALALALALAAGAGPAAARTFVGVGIGMGFPNYPPPPPYYYAPPPMAVPAARPPASTAGQECREYRSMSTIDGRPQETFGTACLQPDGRWRIIN